MGALSTRPRYPSHPSNSPPSSVLSDSGDDTEWCRIEDGSSGNGEEMSEDQSRRMKIKTGLGVHALECGRGLVKERGAHLTSTKDLRAPRKEVSLVLRFRTMLAQ